jgi:hypothetical protein
MKAREFTSTRTAAALACGYESGNRKGVKGRCEQLTVLGTALRRESQNEPSWTECIKHLSVKFIDQNRGAA